VPAASDLILSVLDDIEPLMEAAFDAVGGVPEPGSALDQLFLRDGRVVVVDNLSYGEPGVAFDHLLYMIKEPPLRIAADTMRRLAEAGRELGLSEAAWSGIAIS
jgi:hypothetical protein